MPVLVTGAVSWVEEAVELDARVPESFSSRRVSRSSAISWRSGAKASSRVAATALESVFSDAASIETELEDLLVDFFFEPPLVLEVVARFGMAPGPFP